MTRAAQFGSVSTNTLVSSDLFTAFLYEAEHIKMSRGDRLKVRAISANRVVDGEEDTTDEDVNDLMDILSNNAPAYGYFGARPGDGADFGFWLSEGFEQEFDGLKVNDTSEVPTGYTGEVLHVNDHGNMTLYAYSRGRGREIWGVV